MPSHSHSFTPSGKVSIGNHSHSIDHNHSITDNGHRHKVPADDESNWQRAGGNDDGATGSGAATVVWSSSEKAGISINKYTGSSGSAGAGTYNLIGTTGNTNATGASKAFSILPPFVVKYCWERTS